MTQLSRSGKLRETRKKKGLCYCGRPLFKTFSRCEHCRKSEAKTSKQRRESKIASGICGLCSNPLNPGEPRCLKCKTRRNKSWNHSYQTDAKFRARVILHAAKRKKLPFDVDVEFIENLLNTQCFYCEESRLNFLGLDRIDNSLGYLKSNVVVCCTTCNLIRRDMPYDAWMILAQSMKAVRESGLLGDWSLFKRK